MLGVLAIGVAGQADDDKAEPEIVDEETAKEYNEFRERMEKGAGRMADVIAERYKLRDAQKANVKILVADHADAFIERNAGKMFDLMQRGKAMWELMQETEMSLSDVPLDIRRELGGAALELMDDVQVELNGFIEKFKKELDADQKATLAKELMRMRWGMQMARFQVKVMSGDADPEDAPAPPDGEDAPGQGERRRGATSVRGPRLSNWDYYVKTFIRRHRLDEVQKRKALALLAEYKTKVERLPTSQPTSQPMKIAATGPTSRPEAQPRSMKEFRSRIDEIRSSRKGITDIFTQLKAELDKIPTPAQRKLAEETRRRYRRRGRGPRSRRAEPTTREGK